jgi:hypothetical protein
LPGSRTRIILDSFADLNVFASSRWRLRKAAAKAQKRKVFSQDKTGFRNRIG